eukprot:9491951-Pyramimonas_sp.AAC.2
MSFPSALAMSLAVSVLPTPAGPRMMPVAPRRKAASRERKHRSVIGAIASRAVHPTYSSAYGAE